MSLAEQAVGRHTTALDQEETSLYRERERYRQRYVELLLSGDDSPAATAELADILFQLEDELTPDQVLAYERVIQQARKLMLLHADLHDATAERAREAEAHRAVQFVVDKWLKYSAHHRAEAMDYYSECLAAGDELQRLAVQHPHLFDDGDVPLLVDTSDSDHLAAKARRARHITALQTRMDWCNAAIHDADDAIASIDSAGVPTDSRSYTGYELWRAQRHQERECLQKELDAVASE